MENATSQHIEEAGMDPEAVKRLLEALGEWGVAEQKGLPPQMVDIFAERAHEAFNSVSTAA